jgi:hypothetical protein
MTDTIHTCSYYCHVPACIKAQRDELRDGVFKKLLPNESDFRQPALDWKSVNDFVHQSGVHFEELQGLCLALASKRENPPSVAEELES